MSLLASLTCKTSDSTSDPGLAFGSWRTPNAERPTLIMMEVYIEPSGTSDSLVFGEVDESGGTSVDWRQRAERPTSSGGSEHTMVLYVPAGGSYQVNNFTDPNGNNAVNFIREATL